MNDGNLMLLGVLAVLLIAAAFMKIKLAEKQGKSYSKGWRFQLFLFPVLILLSILLYAAGYKGWVTVLIFFGIIEEAICWAIRKKQK